VDCVPSGLRVESYDLGCCNIEDGCGGSTPIGLKFIGDEETAIPSGYDGKVKIAGRSYYVVNAYSFEQEDDGDCTDRTRHIANYGLVLEMQ
jgi:hypothetical protein